MDRDYMDNCGIQIESIDRDSKDNVGACEIQIEPIDRDSTNTDGIGWSILMKQPPRGGGHLSSLYLVDSPIKPLLSFLLMALTLPSCGHLILHPTHLQHLSSPKCFHFLR